MQVSTVLMDTKRITERLLTNLAPVVPTAYEAVEFEAPEGLYQRCQFVISPPDDPVFGRGYHRERVQFQVFVVGKAGTGTAEVYNRAMLVRDLFHKGATFIEGQARIHILITPQIGGTMLAGGRVVCPVLINLVVEDYNE